MSNLNESDIAEYQKTKNKGLYEVRIMKHPIFDQETGAEIDVEEVYTVCDSITKKGIYPCYDEETAVDLCISLNLLTKDYGLNNMLPSPVNYKDFPDIFEGLCKRITEKHDLLIEIQAAMNHELACELEYTRLFNEIKLNPDMVKTDLELSKNPTEKQIQAYSENKYAKEFKQWKVAKANVSLLNKQLDLIYDYISLEKYYVRGELR